MSVTFSGWVLEGVGGCDLSLARCGCVWLSARFITAQITV